MTTAVSVSPATVRSEWTSGNADWLRTDRHAHERRLTTQIAERIKEAQSELEARRIFRDEFTRLRSRLTLYPVASSRASAVFESAAKTARTLAMHCLPLGIAVSMHLYPLCALQCAPWPLLSPAGLRRMVLLRNIRNRSLILANAGGERTGDAHPPLVATRTGNGILINGVCEYMSLASVADVVFVKAQWTDDCSVLCAADLRADSVQIGTWKFRDSMRLSDTSAVAFVNHRVARGRYMLAPNNEGLRCIANYQRCWFHLFVTEIYLSRLEYLHRHWGLTRSTDQVVSLNELAHLREYALRLLDDCPSRPDIDSLLKTTSTMKLRTSLIAQSAMQALQDRASANAADHQQLQADASELAYIQWQPTADAKILHSLGLG